MRLNESFGGGLKETAPKSFDLRAFEAILRCFCTESGKLIEHIYGFLMIVELILHKYEEKKLGERDE